MEIAVFSGFESRDAARFTVAVVAYASSTGLQLVYSTSAIPTSSVFCDKLLVAWYAGLLSRV